MQQLSSRLGRSLKGLVETCNNNQAEDDEHLMMIPCSDTKAAETLKTENTQPSASVRKAMCVGTRRLRRSKLKGKSFTDKPIRDSRQEAEEPRGAGLFYYFGGTNGAEIVSQYCENRGWKRIYNKQREDFKLKWCETKSAANYGHFREGQQLMFQIPNNKVLTSKIGLLSSLREYERVCSKVNHGQGRRRMNMEEFIPTTFRLDVHEEREAFFSQQQGGSNSGTHMWICKPTGLNQGRGIFLLKSQEDIADLKIKLQKLDGCQDNGRDHHRQSQAHIVQHYIQNPLLLKGKKFDVRSYLLIACTAPYMVFFGHGYLRLTCDLYDPGSNNLSAHLTNQYMQKKNPLYSQLKEDTVWSMESFNAYVNHRFQIARGLPRDWVLGTFTRRMQQIMTQCFFAVKSKLINRLGCFDLIGCDFMIDEDFKVWLLEMNCNPALHTNCKVLKEVIPSTVGETLDLTLEIFNKSRLRKDIFPLSSLKQFVLIYNGASTTDIALKSNTNAKLPLKHPPKAAKTEHRRCKSVTEPLTSPSDSLEVPASSEGKIQSNSGPCSHSFTSLLPQNALSVKLRTKNKKEIMRSRNIRPRVELKLHQCALQAHLKATDELWQPKTHQKKKILMSVSSPALSEQQPISECPAETPNPEGKHKEETEKEDSEGTVQYSMRSGKNS